MNIAFFLLPKRDVVYLSLNCTMRQALEKMEYHGYSAVPVVDDQGKYAGTLTEGDLLWKIKNTCGLNLEKTEKILLRDLPLQRHNEPVKINAQIQDLLSLAINQNFVPVVDDDGVFIGIVRRREIIGYCASLLKASEKETDAAPPGGI
ncbi:MAG TPA: CBS domain-containing protein [Bacillota bacterium]|jgi:CBS domain-containing protein|nr:CBS domain-containing protein [Bacillota bacterium]HOB87826.1 CBS domain-containing protein [Bacillota bacterium]HOP69499.1 CBS domain-containing protein [Bacillota bacterium]HPT34493.1 CBS domain-containing protein [Bacillota bacterium]HPZ65574.1 CBS domain-containing protein [Bacillota bacterium]